MMNYSYNNDDTGSFSSSVCTPEYATPADMTEEEAMEIWMRRDREREERLQRERQQQREMEQSLPEEEVVLERELLQQQRSHGASLASNRSGRRASNGSDGCSLSSDDDLPTEVPAAYSHSDAWQRAISHNVMGAYDPARHNSWVAYQRFVDMNRPGVAENYVPSTPGLARLMDMARREDTVRRERAEKTRREQGQAAAAATALEAQRMQQHAAFEVHQRAQRQIFDHDGPQHYSGQGAVEGGPQDPLIAAQIREYERISQSQAHRSQDVNPTNIAAMVTTASSPTGDSESQEKEGDDAKTNAFYLGTPRTTEYNTKPVTCCHCHAQLYTHPLAYNYLCQTCCQISALPLNVGKTEESRWEEKMMDREDYCEGDMDMAH